jgi:mRNA-degrading endonuclease toxin of MazEF toxin-antitoxin module
VSGLFERGAVLILNLDPIVGHEQGGKRPCIVVMRKERVARQRFPIVVVVPVTGTRGLDPLPRHSAVSRRLHEGVDCVDQHDSWDRCEKSQAVWLGTLRRFPPASWSGSISPSAIFSAYEGIRLLLFLQRQKRGDGLREADLGLLPTARLERRAGRNARPARPLVEMAADWFARLHAEKERRGLRILEARGIGRRVPPLPPDWSLRRASL